MLPSTAETVSTLANFAGSFLLLLVFLLLALVIAALYLLWQALRAARARVRAIAPEIHAYGRWVQVGTEERVDAMITPQIRALSAWEGIKVGARVLVTGEARPALPTPETPREGKVDSGFRGASPSGDDNRP